MPAFGNLGDSGVMDLVAYLRTFNGASVEPPTGDPAKGKMLFAQKGCSSCHMVNGEGGSVGPELTVIGSMRSTVGLREALLNPGTNLPQEGNIADRGRFTQYLMFRAVTKDGHTIEGMRMSETTFMIVLKDVNGNFHSLQKLDLQSLEKEPDKSLMPSFKGVLSDA